MAKSILNEGFALPPSHQSVVDGFTAGTRCFITGSQAYGTPGPDSDIDLVILCDKEVVDKLQLFSDHSGQDAMEEYYNDGLPCLYFGKLNIIFVCNLGLFEVWKKATEFLAAKKPVTREQAIEYVRRKRQKWMFNGEVMDV